MFDSVSTANAMPWTSVARCQFASVGCSKVWNRVEDVLSYGRAKKTIYTIDFWKWTMRWIYYNKWTECIPAVCVIAQSTLLGIARWPSWIPVSARIESGDPNQQRFFLSGFPSCNPLIPTNSDSSISRYAPGPYSFWVPWLLHRLVLEYSVDDSNDQHVSDKWCAPFAIRLHRLKLPLPSEKHECIYYPQE